MLQGARVSFQYIGQWQVHDGAGCRKYANRAERRRFLATADGEVPELRAFLYVLAFTGCRVSEALALKRCQLDPDAKTITFQTLKRRRLIFRTMPVPAPVAAMLMGLGTSEEGRFWLMHRVTAWRHVKRVMAAAHVRGPMACCRGLRHGFGMHAAISHVPPNLIQRWMGHASASTTAIYLDAVGAEERCFAKRMW